MLLLIVPLFLMLEKIGIDENVLKLSTFRHVFKGASKRWPAYIDKLSHRTTELIIVYGYKFVSKWYFSGFYFIKTLFNILL